METVGALATLISMTACGSCGAGNPVGYRFCGQCGSSLVMSECRSCGGKSPAGQAFCGQCGARFDEMQVAESSDSEPAGGSSDDRVDNPEGVQVELEERKLATVLFADVVGFTSLADKTDHEVVARMVDAAFRRLSEVVTEHGGTVDKYMGDSVMAVFGVPVAHDDDAERAVAAGLAMRELGGDLAFSIGINSGEVMAATVGRAGDFTVIGDTVNVAARLETIASAGEVLCGRLTVELAGRGAVFRERRPVLLKGKREPVEVWEAVDIRQMDGLRGEKEPLTSGPPLIGRSDELAFLESQWRRVCRDRRAQVVVICGDAGYGKTRLLGELARSAERDGTVVRAAYPAVRRDGRSAGRRRDHQATRGLRGCRGERKAPVRCRRDRSISAIRGPRGDPSGATLGLSPASPRQVARPAFAGRHRRHAQKRRPDAVASERALRTSRRRTSAHGAGGPHGARRLALQVPYCHEGSTRAAEQSRFGCAGGGFRRGATHNVGGHRLPGGPC